MPLELPFIFDGTANDASVSSLIHIIASLLSSSRCRTTILRKAFVSFVPDSIH